MEDEKDLAKDILVNLKFEEYDDWNTIFDIFVSTPFVLKPTTKMVGREDYEKILKLKTNI